MDKRAIQPNIVSRTTRTAVAAMLASTMCMPLPALAQENRSDNSPTSELQEPSNEETFGDKPDSTSSVANDPSSLQTAEIAIEEAPMTLSAGEDEESSLTYSIDEDGNVTITGTTDETTERGIVIPESIDGHPVTAIAAYAFSGKTPQSGYDLSDRTDLWLTSIYIPNSVKSIGGFAFENNKNLESVHLPENGCTIGHRDRYGDAYDSIFNGCISLKTITIPNGLDVIDRTHFETYISALSAPKLESVTFVKGTSTICNGLLANCPSLKSINIPDSVKSIGACAFRDCEALESVRLPEGGCEIGSKTGYGDCGRIFSGCTSLKRIAIPDGLTTPDVSNSSTEIAGALAAPALESVAIADNASAIDSGLLANCPSLKSVDIPDSVKSIGAFAFSGCEALESVRLPEGGCEIGSVFFSYNDGPKRYGNVFQGCALLTNLHIPKGITALSSENYYAWDYSMFSAPALKSVTFEDSVNALSASMFKNCEALEAVSIPNGVKTIPSYCFSNCKALTSLDIPESVKTIEGCAFKGCGFASIDLPDTVKAIHDGAFADCASLSTVNLPTKGVELGGSYYPSNSNSGTFAGCTALKSITLPDGITGGMLGAPALTNVKFAPGIKKINGLGGCTALSNVIVPDSARQICEGSFSGCVSLQRIDIPEGVTSISNSAFGYCKSLQQVNLPDSLRKIGYNSFGNCTSLQNLQIPTDVAEIGSSAFANCTSLESISLPTNIQQINSSTFENCTSLKSIDLPISVRSIYEHAFYKCYDLANATITPNTTNISSNAFDLSGLENGTITCVRGSAADSFARNADIKRSYYTDSTDYQDVANSSIYLNSYDIRFDGTSAEPKPNVYIGNQYLYSGRDFDIYYENNTAPGTATIVITGKGKYHGTRTFTFQIDEAEQGSAVRLAGESAADTSARIATEAFPEGSEWVVIARDDDFADAMSATGLAGVLNAPIVLTDRYSLSDAAARAVQALGAKKAYIIGGTGAIPGDIEGGLATFGCQTQDRIFGYDSWDTSTECAKKIAEHGGNPGSNAVVAMSTNFQDALSISSYAYKYQVPIFLETDKAHGRQLTEAAVSAIKKLSGTIYVPGGNGAVPQASVEEVFGRERVVRLSGWDGYDTSNQIATYMVEHRLLSPSTICLASGAPDPKGVDALAGAALAGKAGGVVLLTNANPRFGSISTTTIEGADSEGTSAFLPSHAKDVEQAYILGGKAVMPAELQQRVNDILD
ncbi:leucine-rich repeat protein [Senegalimassilia anaerobia]